MTECPKCKGTGLGPKLKFHVVGKGDQWRLVNCVPCGGSGRVASAKRKDQP